MSITYTPPERVANYVAYAKTPKRVGNNETGEAVDFRPSVFVREYATLLVKEFTRKQGEYFGEAFAYGSVKFDASSAGIDNLKSDFGAQIEADGPAFDLLQRAHQAQKPVMVVIETVRRTKNSDTKEPISPLAYIHDLRGAERDGSKGNANITGAACKNVIVGVGAAGNPASFVITGEITSDPAEWASLRSNRDHTLPPNGWRTHEGGVIPTGTNTAGAAAVDVDDIVARVVAAVKPIMADDTSSRPRPAQRASHSSEAKAWEPWNSDGRLNLGGYHVSKERAVFEEAHRMVCAIDPTASIEAAWDLVPVLHWMSDTIQSSTYGEGARANRAAKSHYEAARWASYVYTALAEHDERFVFTKEAITDSGAQQVWAKAVVEAATPLFQRAQANVIAHLTGATPASAVAEQPVEAPAADQQPQPSPSTPAAAGPADDEWASTAAAPVLRERYESLLEGIEQAANPERFHPLLEARFGSWQLREISSTDFEAALTAWENNVQEFIDTAHAAWKQSEAQG